MNFGQLKQLLATELERSKRAHKKNVNFVMTAYNTVFRAIDNSYSAEDRTTKKKIEALPITQHMRAKLIEISSRSPPTHISLRSALSQIMGLGDKKIEELIAAGLRSPSQLFAKKYFQRLTKATQTALMSEMQRKIPHDEITKLTKKILGFKGGRVIIAGSYRRQKPFSRDIDVLVCTNSSLAKYAEYLESKFPGSHLIAAGKDRISIILGPTKYKLDAFRATPETLYTMLLYSTGPKEFSIRLRSQARKKGLLLNQYGIFKNGKKINSPADDEHALFKILGLSYIPPKLRI